MNDEISSELDQMAGLSLVQFRPDIAALLQPVLAGLDSLDQQVRVIRAVARTFDPSGASDARLCKMFGCKTSIAPHHSAPSNTYSAGSPA